MKKLCILIAMLAIVSVAHAELVGIWEFDDSSNLTRSTIGPDLYLTGSQKSVDGVNANDGAVQIDPGSYYTLIHGIDGNGGGNYVNEWTLIFDIKVPLNNKYNSFLQTSVSNNDDADVFIKKNADSNNPVTGHLGVGDTGYALDRVVANTWHRIAIRVDNGNFYELWVDGSRVLLSGNVQAVDGRYSLRPEVLFFTDDDGEEDTVYLSTIALYDTAIPEEELQAFGGATIPLRSCAKNVSPENNETGVAENVTLNWSSPYDNYSFDVYLGTEEPNAYVENYGSSFTKLNGSTKLTETSISVPYTLNNSTKYYWIVDSFTPDGSTLFQGDTWTFTTIPFDTAPIVTATSNYITWFDIMPQTIQASIDDNGENDVFDTGIVWTIDTYPGAPIDNTARVFNRGMTGANALALKEQGYDPNSLSDSIGCDARSDNQGNPLVFVISGLPVGEYTCTTMHHDYNDQTGMFNVYVNDVQVGFDVDATAGNQIPAKFTTQISSDGSTPIKLIFEEVNITGNGIGILLVNSMTITNGVNTMNIDFGTADSNVATGYQAYIASDRILETFTAQDFDFGADTVTIKPEFGPGKAGWIDADLVKISTDNYVSTAAFTTGYVGTYVIKVSATDDAVYGPEAMTGADTIVIQVVENACEAAQKSDSWEGFNIYDANKDCKVNLLDFAEFAANWLTDSSVTEAVLY